MITHEQESQELGGAFKTALYVGAAVIGPFAAIGFLGAAALSMHDQQYIWSGLELAGFGVSGIATWKGIRGVRRELTLAKKTAPLR